MITASPGLAGIPDLEAHIRRAVIIRPDRQGDPLNANGVILLTDYKPFAEIKANPSIEACRRLQGQSLQRLRGRGGDPSGTAQLAAASTISITVARPRQGKQRHGEAVNP